MFKKYLFARSASSAVNDDVAMQGKPTQAQPSLPMKHISANRFPSPHLDNNEPTEHNWETLALWLYINQQRKTWLTGLPDEGVVLKRGTDDHVCWPSDMSTELVRSIKALNVKASEHAISANFNH